MQRRLHLGHRRTHHRDKHRKQRHKTCCRGFILVVVKSKVLMHRLPVAIAKVPMCHGQDIKSIQCAKELHPEFARFRVEAP